VLHAGRQPAVERHVGSFRQTVEARLYPHIQVPDAQTALQLIDGWIKDYNEIHPHSALKMASPRQFIRAKST
jgi:transposase InsO family protein